MLGVLSVVGVVGVLGAGAERARACGPDFPARLLEDRRATMGELIEGTFAWDAAHLVPPPAAPDRFRVVEGEAAASDDDARRKGSAEERALYDEAAARWNHGESLRSTNLEGDDEVALWKRLLALPKEKRQARSTWAAFMLGRVTRDARWFEQTRALARAGFDDDLGLAAASLGEEARIHLDEGDIPRAVHLYAQQAALGSGSGIDSLLQVARELTGAFAGGPGAPALRDRDLRDPIVQRLVASYLNARANEIDARKTSALLARIDAQHLQSFAGADQLAAAAYRSGNYAMAARFLRLAGNRTALALHVAAKLALRDGREPDARALLARAAAALPARSSAAAATYTYRDGGDLLSLEPHARVDAERAVLALHQRQYVRALDLLVRGGDDYWLDAAYVAERVLTSPELVQYVDAKGTDAPPRLRALLARRLVREHRFGQALAYFDGAQTRAWAATYVDAYVRGFIEDGTGDAAGGDGVARARQRYAAATTLRAHGLEISGTELDPDWAVFDGAFDLGEPWWSADDDDGLARPPGRIDAMMPGPAFATYDEQMRVLASQPQPLLRFHYRAVAAELLNAAADDVPPRSQAFAALLCQASSWLIDREPARAARYWDRYVKQGASVDFAATFGRSCPAPAFDRATSIAWHPPALSSRTTDARARRPLGHAVRDTALLVALAYAAKSFASAFAQRRRGPPIDPV